MKQNKEILKFSYRPLGIHGLVEIKREHFDGLKHAQENSFIILGIEEKFDMLLYNFIDFEQVLLSMALRNSLFNEAEWSPTMNQISLVNRHLGNLLMTCTMYIDQTKHDFKTVVADNEEQFDQLIKYVREEYDNNFSYRLMTEIRNYMQHRSTPIHGMSYSGCWKPANTSDISSFERLEFQVTPWINPESLDTKKFKKAVLNELSGLGEEVNLLPHVRRYVESLGRIHERIRKILQPLVEKSDKLITSHIREAQNKFSNDKINITQVVSRGPSEKALEEIHIFKQPIERRKALERKNLNLGSIASRCVSSCHGDQRIRIIES